MCNQKHFGVLIVENNSYIELESEVTVFGEKVR